MQLLIDNNATINHKGYKRGDPSDQLLGAIFQCREDAISLLLDASAEFQNLFYENISFAVAHRGNAKVVDLIFRRDSNVSITGEIIVAAAGNFMYGHEVVQYLLAVNEVNEVETLEAAVNEAARNSGFGNRIMEAFWPETPTSRSRNRQWKQRQEMRYVETS
jgi:hypothetical protein